MLAIICAMKSEAEVIISRLEEAISTPNGEFFCGKLNGSNVIVAICSPGKVNAAICATEMLLAYGIPYGDGEHYIVLDELIDQRRIDCVLNLGVVGGLIEEYQQGDVVLPFAFVQSDVDTTAVGDPPGYISGIGAEKFIASSKLTALKTALTLKMPSETRVFIADLCATADRFLGTYEQKRAVRDQWKASICDMEAGAIAQACSIAGIPFLSAKVVTDTLYGDAKEYEDTLPRAAVLLADIAEIAAGLSKSRRW